MSFPYRTLSSFALLGPSAIAQAQTQTGGSMTYGPASAAVPISALFLVPLGIAMAFLGYRAIRKHGAAHLIGVLLMLGGVGTVVSSGFQVQEAVASAIIELSNPDGGTVDLPETSAEYRNTSGVPLEIGSVTPPPARATNAPVDECVSGLVLADQERCSTEYFCIRPPESDLDLEGQEDAFQLAGPIATPGPVTPSVLLDANPSATAIGVRYIRFEANDANFSTDSQILGAVSNGDGDSSVGTTEQAQLIISFGDEFRGSTASLSLTAQVSGTWNWDGGTLIDGSLFDDNWSLSVNDNFYGSFWYNAVCTTTEGQLLDSLTRPVFTHGTTGSIDSGVNFTDLIQVGNVEIDDDGNVVLDFTAATTETTEIVTVEAVATVDLPDTYIYEIDMSAAVTEEGGTLSVQITGTNSGSLTSTTGNTNVTENPAGSGIWDITFVPADPGNPSISDVLELRILESNSVKLDLIATSSIGGGSDSIVVSTATWTDGVID
jgi:hypothetical protein